MSGIPAGYEDDYDDYEDFNLTENNYTDYYDVSGANGYQDGVRVHSTGDAKKLDSVFNQYRSISKDLKDELSLTNENIRSAIIDGKTEYIEHVLTKGFQPDTVLKSGWSALMYAASEGSLEIIKILLEQNASVNFKSGSLSPIMVLSQAVKKGEDHIVECAKVLIKYGANINDHDKHIMTALMYASQQGLAKFVSLLCKNGAIIDVQESRGWSALCFAASSGYSHVVKVLLEHGADYNVTTLQGEKPTDLAFSNGFIMLSELLEKYDGRNIEGLDAVPQESSRLTKTKTEKYVNYGDIELFLFGLDLGHLVPVLQEQHLSFTQLLTLTENELTEAGVTKLGDRKTLYSALQNVRSNSWDTSNLSNKDLMKLGTLDTAAVIANATKHLDCIKGCLVYAHRVIVKKKDTINEDNANLQRALIQQCQEVQRLAKQVGEEAISLNNDVVRFFPNADQIEVDHIGSETNALKSSGRRKFLFLSLLGIATTAAGGFFVYKWLKKPI